MQDYLKPENYVLRFGKYNKLRAVDVLHITEVDKNGEDKPAGLLYLKWLVEKADWFKHKEIIQQILKDASVEDVDTETKEIVEEIKKPKIKKESKPTEKEPKKAKEGTVQISTENNVLEFQ